MKWTQLLNCPSSRILLILISHWVMFTLRNPQAPAVWVCAYWTSIAYQYFNVQANIRDSFQLLGRPIQQSEFAEIEIKLIHGQKCCRFSFFFFIEYVQVNCLTSLHPHALTLPPPQWTEPSTALQARCSRRNAPPSRAVTPGRPRSPVATVSQPSVSMKC